MDATKPYIRAEHVSFRYESENEHSPEVLNDVSMTVRRGEFLALLGHNGCGKSTLAKHFNAMLLPSGGKVWVQDMDTADESKIYSIRARVGLIQQNPDNQLVASIWAGKPRPAARRDPPPRGRVAARGEYV